uniref:Uncharacterized protein n=1 Tax=Panthera tigris altaica TaxID=74533 RepID=A0A8C9JEA1_PANTA
IIEGRCCVLHNPDTVGEEKESALTHTTHDQKFAQQEKEVGNFGPGGGGRQPEDGAFPDLMMFLMSRKKPLVGRTFEALIQVFEHHSDDLHNGQNEGAKGQGACVVPEGQGGGREEWEGRQVVWLVQGPVVGGEGPRKRDLAQGQHEVGQPEEHEGIENLQAQQGPVVAGFTTIEGELAVGTGAQARFIGGGEGLREGWGAGSQHRGQDGGAGTH